MIKKDAESSQDMDFQGKRAEDRFKEERERKYSEEAKGVAEVNVKNANAAGDGALGRSDESLPSNDSSTNPEID